MLVSELPVRTIKSTDYFIIETEGEATFRCHFDAAELGLATAQSVTDLSGKLDQAKQDLQKQITDSVTSVYVVKGSVPFESLPTVAETTVGWVYNVTNDFVTSEDFVEGSGKSYVAGTNVVCTSYSDGGNKWDILGDSKIDLSSYATKEEVKTGTTDKDTEQDAKLQQLQTAVETAQAAADAAKSAAEKAQTAATAAQTAADKAEETAEAAQKTADGVASDLAAYKQVVKLNYIEVRRNAPASIGTVSTTTGIVSSDLGGLELNQIQKDVALNWKSETEATLTGVLHNVLNNPLFGGEQAKGNFVTMKFAPTEPNAVLTAIISDGDVKEPKQITADDRVLQCRVKSTAQAITIKQYNDGVVDDQDPDATYTLSCAGLVLESK